MPRTKSLTDLSRRERQIMDVLYRRGRATAAEVLSDLPDPPSYSAVRALLRVLEDKGHVRHEQRGPAYTYLPTLAPAAARRSAVSHLLRTFFNGSAEQAVAALLDASDELTPGELDRISRLIAAAKREGR